MERKYELFKLCLSFPSLSPVCKTFAALISHPWWTALISCLNLKPAENLVRTDEFYLAVYWNRPFWKCQRKGWALRGNVRVGSKEGRPLPFSGSMSLEQLPLEVKPSCNRRPWLMYSPVRLVLSNRGNLSIPVLCWVSLRYRALLKTTTKRSHGYRAHVLQLASPSWCR